MVQKVPSSKLGSRSARLRLPVRKKPYFMTIDRGLALGYRRTQTAGTWVMRITRDGGDWTQAIGKADDHEEPGPDIMTFGEAQTHARELAKAGKPGGSNTVAAAIDRHETDLANRGGNIRSVPRVRLHLTAKLANKPVDALTQADLSDWRDSLLTKMKPASVNRTITVVRAALNLAADENERITKRPWKTGLKAVAGAGKARNVILSEADVRAVIGAAYRDSERFGELVELAGVTGARPSQLLRLQGEDVQADFINASKRQPRLMMPTSKKGKGEKKISRRPVPIPESLAKRLSGRTGQLLQRPTGDSPWEKINLSRHFELAIKGVELSQPKVTIYALRHTSIVRQLLAGVPIRVVAALHDTSVQMIEQNYSEHIADHADDLARPTLLETMAEVIALPPLSAKARAKKGIPEVPG
jgi:integrase